MVVRSEHDTLPPSMDPIEGEGVREPPRSFGGIVRSLGPGLIIAGSIVGSGELIATTKTGAQAGIALLWLIIVGCLIKVFVQLELGRFAISHGETTLAALDRVPGPRWRANWIMWFWVIMTLATIGQLGGIVGGVGQALALTAPIKGDYARAIRTPDAGQFVQYLEWDDLLLSEWDLQILQEARDEEAGGRWAEWEAEAAARTRGQLETLSAHGFDETDELVSLSARLAEFPASRRHIPEKVQARKELRALLQRANRMLVEESDDPRAKGLRGSVERKQRRVLRSHAILSSQLADVDRNAHRAAKILVLAVPLHEARTALAAAKGNNADKSTLAGLEKNVKDHTKVVEAQIEPYTYDDKIWAGIIAVFTSGLLFWGRYNMIQRVATVLVVTFTFVTIGNVISLQSTAEWGIPFDEFMRGLSLGIPEATGGKRPMLVALAAFGIIGVGATELIAYPYWCLEKGYARFAGPRDDSDSWVARAKGWIRVMHYDAFASMVIYTIATLAFFVMGVAVLYNDGLDPDGMRMVSTLAEAYVPVFGAYAKWLFLCGAVAVLYSTYMVANAGNARMVTDCIKVFRLIDRDSDTSHTRCVTALSVLLPLLCFAVFVTGANPVRLVLFAGMMQATMLPIIGFSSIYFRYRLTDRRLQPPRWWDILLALSCVGLLVAGGWGVYSRLAG